MLIALSSLAFLLGGYLFGRSEQKIGIGIIACGAILLGFAL